MDQRGTKWIWILSIFKYLNECYRVEKVDEKNGVICLVSMFPCWGMVLKLPKKVHFMQFCADFSKKSNSAKAISIYATESSYYTLSENGMILTIKISKKMLTKQKFNNVL